MGMLVAECSQIHSVDNNNNSNSNKKKKRRSRRSKHTSPTASTSEDGCLRETNVAGGIPTSNNEGSIGCMSQGTSYIAFNSLPTMHINEQTRESETLPMQQILSPGIGGQVLSSSCPSPIVYEGSGGVYINEDPLLCQHISSHSQRKYFTSHWPVEAVQDALEKGGIFKASFRVNAHNRLEAYCKIEGVQTDVLISGVASQNRAVEGDIVAIEIDPPYIWTKMKGFTATVADNSASLDNGTSDLEISVCVEENMKGKNTLDTDNGLSSCKNCLCPSENCFCRRNGYSCGKNINPEQSNEVVDAAQRLSAVVNLFPSKRPTGRVVAILKGSPRRDSVVGFLSVKKWMNSREGNKKDLQKNRHSMSAVNCQYLLLTPTDPRFPKMMVPFKSLPDIIKKRLENGDVTVEMELIAARIADWIEENYIPEAHIIDIFGQAGELETQVAAILFENAINASEFSQETLSCLPSVPWEVPREEVENRRDIRNLCVLTIDPTTATDLDDALSIEKLPDGNFRVGVHIADVSYFVQPGTPLDIDAQTRSTSVYLLQSKLPMLPPLLSEELGSLNPGVDRLAFSIFWDINLAGKALDRWIGRTVIKSCCKLAYEHAHDIIDGVLDDPSSSKAEHSWPKLHGNFEWSDVITSVKNLYELSKILKKNRFNDGALALESPKIVFLFNEDGIPYDSALSGRTNSNFLVEEFMLLANRTAAEVITRAYPTTALLRRHPEPNFRKLREFESFCCKHGLKMDTSSSGQLYHSLQHIKQELKDDPALLEIIISYATRPMQLAAYFCSGDLTDENDRGHYALAIPLYTHFTSPLRRYPDILVHRMLAATVEAEELYLKCRQLSLQNGEGQITRERCFTGVCLDKDAIGSPEAQKALLAAASKHKVPCAETLAGVAAHCNERKLASRHVKDATEKLYLWVLLKKKKILLSDARVLALGPRFMTLYIHKLAIERRIYYDEVEGLTVEWLDSTSTLVLSPSVNKRFNRRGSPGKCRALDEVSLIVNPCKLSQEFVVCGQRDTGNKSLPNGDISRSSNSDVENVEPAVFPMTLRLLSTIPVALHADGGGDGPLEIGVRLFVSSYFT